MQGSSQVEDARPVQRDLFQDALVPRSSRAGHPVQWLRAWSCISADRLGHQRSILGMSMVEAEAPTPTIAG